MRLVPSDPDVETLTNRISGGEIDLRPEFQRGEVWSLAKRQKLIDSILRDWHIPPIHVIERADDTLGVLDGQQRLASIRDFVAGEFGVDGSVEPNEPKLKRLHGKRFIELPPSVQRKFLRFTIRLFTIVDYKSTEPGELFYRLNQPTSLTPAEQRNAFFGTARSQVKELVGIASEQGSGMFGFSNARMTYDDAITRALFLLNEGSLRQKVTAAGLADKFRSDRPFSSVAVRKVKKGLRLLSTANTVMGAPAKLNKATAESWLVFLSAAQSRLGSVVSGPLLVDYFIAMESGVLRGQRTKFSAFLSRSLGRKLVETAIEVYQNRSTSRVADVSSVVLRDFVLWVFFLQFAEFSGAGLGRLTKPYSTLRRMLNGREFQPRDFEDVAEHLSWGYEI